MRASRAVTGARRRRTKSIIYGINASTDSANGLRLGDRTAANNWKLSPTDSTSWVQTDGQATGVGMTRQYYGAGGLPATFSETATTGGLGTNVKKRCNITWKKHDPTQVLAGDADVDFCTYVNAIPSGWEIAMTYYHEPNGDLNTTNFTADKYRQAQIRLGALLEGRTMASISQTAKAAAAPAVSLATGVKVYMAVCISGPRGTAATAPTSAGNNWDTGVVETSVKNCVPNAADMDAAAILLLDNYQNPPPAIAQVIDAGNPTVESLYPTPTAINGFFVANVLSQYGYDTGGRGWGIGETMAPLRTNDDAAGSGQTAAVESFLTYCEAVNPPPRVILLWEAPTGVSFDQTAVAGTRRVIVQHALGQYAV